MLTENFKNSRHLHSSFNVYIEVHFG